MGLHSSSPFLCSADRRLYEARTPSLLSPPPPQPPPRVNPSSPPDRPLGHGAASPPPSSSAFVDPLLLLFRLLVFVRVSSVLLFSFRVLKSATSFCSCGGLNSRRHIAFERTGRLCYPCRLGSVAGVEKPVGLDPFHVVPSSALTCREVADRFLNRSLLLHL
jgi:hypothetical protein